MADVSVEFGAKDTGLEKTLKAVQAEMEQLTSDVKSGELSFGELQQTMRKLSQASKLEDQLRGLSDATSESGDSASDAASQIDDSSESMDEMGTSAKDAGDKSEMGFLKMAGAVAVGQAAVEVAMAAIKSAISAVTGTFDKFGEAISRGAELDILASRTGVASGELARLQRALENTGASGDMIGPIFDRMNRVLSGSSEEGSKASAALVALGLNVEEIKNMSPEKQFEMIGTALNGIADTTERAALAQEIFTRGSGTRLLRLFNDYEGTMARVDQQLGLFPSIMNEMSKSFENASTEINAARQKFVEFAAGILSRLAPAIEAVATGLASIDAAKLGQQFADGFLGAEKSLKGFQTVIDAFSTGLMMDAMKLLWASIKLQSMETSNSVYQNLTAAFNTAADAMLRIFGPRSGFFTLIIDAFSLAGKKAGQLFAQGILDILPTLNSSVRSLIDVMAIAMPNLVGPIKIAIGAADASLGVLKSSIDGMNDGLVKQAAKLEDSYVNFSENAKKSLGKIPEDYHKNLKAANAELFNTQDGIKEVTDLEEKLKAKIAERNATSVKGENEIKGKIEENRKLRETAEEEAAAAAERARAVQRQMIELETEINSERVAGNEEAAKALEVELKKLKTQEEINALTEQYSKMLEIDVDEARKLATEFVNSKSSAQQLEESLKNSKSSVTEMREELALSAGLMNQIASAQMKDAIDKGGRLEKRAREQMQRGNFAAAERTVRRIEQKELEASIRGGDRRSMADIGREAGLSMRPGETGTEFTKRIAEAKGIDSLKQPGEQGSTGRDMKKGEAAQSPLEKLVAEIKELVKKIEPKLPMQALA
jgi:hypothetical protein